MKLARLDSLLILATIVIVATIASGDAAVLTASKGNTLETKGTWESKWQSAVARARTEGRVVIYSHLSPQTIQWLTLTFKNKYGVNLEIVSGPPTDIVQRMLKEQQANIKAVDVVILDGGQHVNTFNPMNMVTTMENHLILPEVIDGRRWMGGKFPWFNKDRTAVSPVAGYFSYILINTDLVKKDEINAYQDLLDPKWKGKITTFDPTKPSPTHTFVHYVIPRLLGPEAGKKYLESLAKQELAYTVDSRQILEWVARGKYPIALGASGATAVAFMKAGSPISFVRPKEGGLLATSANVIAIAKQAPHPNATDVFINWLLTDEGQAGYAANQLLPSLRQGVQYTGPDQFQVVRPDDKTINSDEGFYVEGKKRLSWAKEIFGPYIK